MTMTYMVNKTPEIVYILILRYYMINNDDDDDDRQVREFVLASLLIFACLGGGLNVNNTVSLS